MKVGLIVDCGTVTRWQADALSALPGDEEVILYNCLNSRPTRKRLRHAFYYALNLVSLRTRLTARTRIPSTLNITGRHDFDSEYDDRGWQSLPQSLLDRMAVDMPGLIIKFGMGLLRVPPALACPILSFHHGDPREYRGRPAGFYELDEGKGTVGQVVQILSDRLDGGEIVAFAETKAHAHSWRRTMAEAYRASPLLLPAAVHNVLTATRLPIAPDGRRYRLPSTRIVVRFLFNRAGAWLKRLTYGLLFEKAWEVAEAPLPSGPIADLPHSSTWSTIERPQEHRFLADPFYHPRGGVLVEALRTSTGLGEILHVAPDGRHVLLSGKGHYSYPCTAAIDGSCYLLPEVSEWSPPLLFRFNGTDYEPLGELKVPGRARLIDPTLYASEGTVYLFANLASEGSGVLRLWLSDSAEGEFTEHSRSPIRISPAGSRMGGAVIEHDGLRIRVGQDFRGQYGDGIILYRIEKLSRDVYRETEAGALRFTHCRGPHTLNLGEKTILFDFYRDRFSIGAGFRRLRSALLRRADRIGRGPNTPRETRNSAR